MGSHSQALLVLTLQPLRLDGQSKPSGALHLSHKKKSESPAVADREDAFGIKNVFTQGYRTNQSTDSQTGYTLGFPGGFLESQHRVPPQDPAITDCWGWGRARGLWKPSRGFWGTANWGPFEQHKLEWTRGQEGPGGEVGSIWQPHSWSQKCVVTRSPES